MRFHIAAAVLACQAATPSSFDLDEKRSAFTTKSTSNVWKAKKKNSLSAASNPKRHRQEHKTGGRTVQKKRRGGATTLSVVRGRPLINNGPRSKTSGRVVECDPYHIDTGILQCGSGSYCAESKESSKGGVCVALSNTRNLQQQNCASDIPCPEGSFCDQMYGSDGGGCEICPCGNPATACIGLLGQAFYNPDAIESCTSSCGPGVGYCQQYAGTCNFDYFDTATGTGTTTCYGASEYCYDDGADCCYAYAITRTFEDGAQTSSSYEYYFSAPYSQNVTITYGGEGSGCGILFNGDLCNSCTQTSDYQNCIQFDCTNSPGGQAGNTCDDDGMGALLPVSNQCVIYEMPDSYCNFCGEGPLPYPDAVIGVDGYEYSCQYLFDYNMYFESNSTQCDYASYYYAPICCEGAAPCNICGEGGSLTYPNATFDIPDYGEVTCYALGYGGMFGLISPGECAVITGIARPTCCEMPPEPSTCYVCPNDWPVTNPDALVDVDSLPDDTTCQQLQDFGRQGLIPSELCTSAQTAALSNCGCAEPTETDPPVQVTEPTDAPMSEPTNPPEPVPTDPPMTPEPTEPTAGSSNYKDTMSLFGLSLAVATLYSLFL